MKQNKRAAPILMPDYFVLWCAGSAGEVRFAASCSKHECSAVRQFRVILRFDAREAAHRTSATRNEERQSANYDGITGASWAALRRCLRGFVRYSIAARTSWSSSRLTRRYQWFEATCQIVVPGHTSPQGAGGLSFSKGQTPGAGGFANKPPALLPI